MASAPPLSAYRPSACGRDNGRENAGQTAAFRMSCEAIKAGLRIDFRRASDQQLHKLLIERMRCWTS